MVAPLKRKKRIQDRFAGPEVKMREQRVIDLADRRAEEPSEPPPQAIDRWRQAFARQIEMMTRWVRTLYLRDRAFTDTGSQTYDVQKHYAAWDGGQDRYGRTHESVWFRVVQHLVEIGANPQDYIWLQVSSQGRSRNPTPLQMLDPEATVEFSGDYDRVADLRRSLEQEYASVCNEAVKWTRPLSYPVPGFTPWAPLKAFRYALANVGPVNATPFVRYCIGAEMLIADVCEEYRDEALSQYAFERANYEAAWGQRIPHDFRQAGAALVMAILGTRME
jgi:hypothetical protein